MRNGIRAMAVLAESGSIEIIVPRVHDGLFERVIVSIWKRRLDGIDLVVLSLSARGLTTCVIVAHFEEIYGVRVFEVTISKITEKVAGDLAEWSSRPLHSLHLLLFVDAIGLVSTPSEY